MYPSGVSTFGFMNFNLISLKGDNSVIAYILRLKSFGSVVLNKDQISFFKFSRDQD